MMEQPNPYRTKSGRILTQRELDALVEEAERGYDVDELARRPGRPRLGSAPALVVQVRLHSRLDMAVKRLATVEKTSVSDVVRRALDAYLGAEPPTLGLSGLKPAG